MDLTYADLCDSRMVQRYRPYVDQLIQRCYLPGGTKIFFQKFLAPMFPRDDKWIPQREQHLLFLEDNTIPKGYICATRGFFKTTSLIGYMIKCIVLREQTFWLHTSQTEDNAGVVTDAVRAQVLGNTAIQTVFGNLRPETYMGTNPVFSKKAWVLSDPITGAPFFAATPKGEGQQVNGALFPIRGYLYRPTFLSSDDGESRTDVLQEELRKKHDAWYWGAFLPCVNQDAYPDPKTHRWIPDGPGWLPPYRIIHQDTLKHESANMATIMQSPEWFGHVFPKCEWKDVDGEEKLCSCCAELWSDEEVRSEWDAFERRGQGDIFAMEYMCQPMARNSDGWSKRLFKYYSDAGLGLDKSQATIQWIVVDPSKTSTSRSAFTAILSAAADWKEKIVYLRKMIVERLHMNDIPKKALELAVEMNCPQVAVEITGLEEMVKYLFMTAATEMGLDHWIEFIWLDARGVPRGGDYGTGKEAPKRARASYLLPLYREGRIFHDESLRDSHLEKQMLQFPKCSYWDALDTVGYIPQLLDADGRFYIPTVQEKQLREEFKPVVPQRYGERKPQKEYTPRFEFGDKPMRIGGGRAFV